MESQQGFARPLTLNVNQAQATQNPPNNVANRRKSSSAMSTPISSAPPTPNPNLSTPTARRPSHPATSPLTQSSPRPPSSLRRTSSAQGLNERPTSSPKLMRKGSRSSLGAPREENENDKRPTPKRSISNLISGLREAQTRMEAIEEPVPLTAPQIAIEHFTRELFAHGRPDVAAETVVLLHDACYGHRYSRLKATKTTLSLIVERPERIHASILGASAAYVRLGGHHAGATNAPHPDRTGATTPPFKIRRTGRSMDITSPFVTNVHGTAWMTELRQLCVAAGERLAAGAKELSRSSTPTEPQKRKLHEGDLYLCSESLNAFQGALGGVADAVDTIFAPASLTKRAFVAIRPPGHHCSADHPSGFCWINNVHVGIEYAAQTYGLTHAAILDFDLHHGDGSQSITWERNSKNNEKRLNAKPSSKLKLNPDIGYYSLHDINSYPCEMGDDEKVQAASLCIENAHGQSVWNVHLQPWKTEGEFWQLYETQYRVLLDKARIFLRHHAARIRSEGKVTPKAAIFISAGFDASEWEGSGMQRHKVNVPTEFYARFTRDVVELAQEEDTACEGRVISVLEGGYSDQALCSGVWSHLSGLCATPIEHVKKEEPGISDLNQMMRGLGINGVVNAPALHYDKTWWSAANLTALGMKINVPPPPQGKKSRIGPQPTYATPTESFAYKVIDADKFARSISGTMRDVQRPARPPTPPPPEVDWVIATQQLSKLLTPVDRQTKSCTAEELGGVKPKKEAASAVLSTAAGQAGKPRQLRDRKAKAPAYPGSSHSDELESLRSDSRSSRRQTIADLPSNGTETTYQRRASRRLSAGSTLSSITAELDPSPPPLPTIPGSSVKTTAIMKPPQAPVAGVQVKKTRAPAKPKTASTTASAPASPSRANKAPSRLSGPAVSTMGTMHTGVDALASGMKKITLKAGTKEEHDRKQKEKIDANRRAGALKAAETRKANAAAKKAAMHSSVQPPKAETEQPMQQSKENAPPPAPMFGQEQSMMTANQPPAFAVQPISNEGFNLPMMITESEPAAPMLPDYATSDANNQPVPTYTNEIPQEVALPSPSFQPVQDHNIPSLDGSIVPVYPPNTETVSPIPMPTTAEPIIPVPDSAARQLIRENDLANTSMAPPPPPPSFPSALPKPQYTSKLPVWSSTGTIPFASSNGAPMGPPHSVPQGSFGTVTSANTNTLGSGIEPQHTVMDAVAGTTAVKPDPAEGQAPSIWDVPETPQR